MIPAFVKILIEDIVFVSYNSSVRMCLKITHLAENILRHALNKSL